MSRTTLITIILFVAAIALPTGYKLWQATQQPAAPNFTSTESQRSIGYAILTSKFKFQSDTDNFYIVNSANQEVRLSRKNIFAEAFASGWKIAGQTGARNDLAVPENCNVIQMELKYSELATPDVDSLVENIYCKAGVLPEKFIELNFNR